MNVPPIDGVLSARVRQGLYLTAVVLIVVSGTADAVYAGAGLEPTPLVAGAQKGLLYLAAALLTMGAAKITQDRKAGDLEPSSLNVVVHSPGGNPGEVADEVRQAIRDYGRTGVVVVDPAAAEPEPPAPAGQPRPPVVVQDVDD